MSDTRLPATLRVLVLAEDPLVRAALAQMIAAEPGVEVVGQGAVSEVGLNVAAECALFDVGPDPSRVEERLALLDAIRTPVVVLLPDDTHAADVLLGPGRAVLVRNTPPATLVAALHAVARGLLVVDPQMRVALAPVRERSTARVSEDLTARELEVLQLLAAGLPNRLVAKKLGISEHTAKFHVNSILGKLDVQSRTEAVVKAARLGLVIL